MIVLERIVNEGACGETPGSRGCDERCVASGHLVVEAHLDDDGRAHARLPVHEQVADEQPWVAIGDDLPRHPGAPPKRK